VGVSLLLIILVVISMTTLSVLALLSSVNDLKLTQKRQVYVTELARASAQYESALFTISEANHAGDSRQAEINGVSVVWQENTALLTAPFHDYMAVGGAVNIMEKGVEQKFREVINLSEWEADDSLDLFSGGFIFSTADWPEAGELGDIEE